MGNLSSHLNMAPVTDVPAEATGHQHQHPLNEGAQTPGAASSQSPSVVEVEML